MVEKWAKTLDLQVGYDYNLVAKQLQNSWYIQQFSNRLKDQSSRECIGPQWRRVCCKHTCDGGNESLPSCHHEVPIPNTCPQSYFQWLIGVMILKLGWIPFIYLRSRKIFINWQSYREICYLLPKQSSWVTLHNLHDQIQKVLVPDWSQHHCKLPTWRHTFSEPAK